MRLIDADALTEKYGDWYTEEGTEEGYIGTIRGIVESAPTIYDAPAAQPEIIRCKDCRKNPNWEWVGCPMAGKSTRKPDDFCSYAERKTDE